MNWYRSIGVHVEQRSLHDVDHLIASSSVDCDLEMTDHDAEITTEAAKLK